MALTVTWDWKNRANKPAEYDGPTNCGNVANSLTQRLYLGRGPRDTHASLGITHAIPYIDNFNQILRFNILDDAVGAARAIITIYEDDTEVIKYKTPLLLTTSDENDEGDIKFTIGQAQEDDAEYLTGTASTVIGNYGTETAIKFSVIAWNDGLTAQSNELWSGGGTSIGGGIATVGVAFYTPPYFMTQYPDEFENTGHTGEHYTLVQSITETSAYIVVNSPHTIPQALCIQTRLEGQSWENPVFHVATGLTGVQKIELTGLTANTTYYYRLAWGIWASPFYGQDKTFKTLAPAGVSTKVVLQADTHSMFGMETYIARAKSTMLNIKKYSPDFIVDFGDTQGGDLSSAYFSDEYEALYAMSNGLFQYLDTPIQYHVPGNHEMINSYYQNIIPEDPVTTYIPSHYGPWQSPEYGGNARIKYLACLDHGESPALDYKTFTSWEHGDAVYICLDPYLYTTVYPTHCEDNVTFTLGTVQQAWFENIMATTTKKWKYIFAHQHLGGENLNFANTVCYGKSSAGGFHRGQNLTEIYPSITDPKHTIIFLGHDHVYMIDKYEDLIFVRVPGYGLWTASQSWNQNQYGYDITRKFQGSSITVGNVPHGYFQAEVAIVPTDEGDYDLLTYKNESGDEIFDIVLEWGNNFFGPSTLTNITRDKQLSIYHATSYASGLIPIDRSAKTIKLVKELYPLGQRDSWQVGDRIGILFNTPGFLTLDTTADKTVIKMMDCDGVPVPNSKITIKD